MIFGRLLRLWRKAAQVSQEELAEAIGISTRHLSFLETGKATASLAFVTALADHFDLGERERGNLIQAAGLLPSKRANGSPDAGEGALRCALAVSLSAFGPYPAAVIDPCANIKMVNRAWVLENRRLYGERAMAPDVNSIKLLVHKYAGLRDAAVTDLICLYLLILQQEAIIRDSQAAAALIAEVTRAEGVPKDWLMRGAAIARRSGGHSHREIRADSHGRQRVVWNVHHTIGSTPYVSEPRLLLHVVVPEDGAPEMSVDDLSSRADLDHPLLAPSPSSWS